MALYINGEKIDDQTIEKYHLKVGMAAPFSTSVITESSQTKGNIKIEGLQEK